MAKLIIFAQTQHISELGREREWRRSSGSDPWKAFRGDSPACLPADDDDDDVADDSQIVTLCSV